MKCPVCGADNEAGASFCFRCGSSLKSTTAAVGPTVTFDSGATPRYGSETVLAADEEHNARVYDAPAPAANAGARPYAEPSAGSNPGGYAPSTQQYGAPRSDQPQAPVYQQPGMVMVQQSNTALIALVLGIVSFVGLSIFAAIPAVILGRNARKEIQASGGMITGDGMAQAGIVLGWINIGLTLFVACAFCAIPLLGILGASAGG